MSPALRKYFQEIGRQGGAAVSKRKASAVRRNGVLGGRPRKDGMPPGSRPLFDVIKEIDASSLPIAALDDLKLWAQSNASLYKEHEPWLERAVIVKVVSMIRRSN